MFIIYFVFESVGKFPEETARSDTRTL